MNSKPIWPYVAIVFGGVVFFAGAVMSLVAMVHKTGFDQYYWASQAIILVMVLSLLAGMFVYKQ